tara:strand:+ start:263 stop:466 length:204 start_codon:yes stop_codon:yes gene_type:complete
MRIINIINNDLVIQKQKLEEELERVLNLTDTNTEDKLKQALELINKLSMVTASFATWELYQSKEKEN